MSMQEMQDIQYIQETQDIKEDKQTIDYRKISKCIAKLYYMTIINKDSEEARYYC